MSNKIIFIGIFVVVHILLWIFLVSKSDKKSGVTRFFYWGSLIGLTLLFAFHEPEESNYLAKRDVERILRKMDFAFPIGLMIYERDSDGFEILAKQINSVYFRNRDEPESLQDLRSYDATANFFGEYAARASIEDLHEYGRAHLELLRYLLIVDKAKICSLHYPKLCGYLHSHEIQDSETTRAFRMAIERLIDNNRIKFSKPQIYTDRSAFDTYVKEFNKRHPRHSKLLSLTETPLSQADLDELSLAVVTYYEGIMALPKHDAASIWRRLLFRGY